MSFKLDVHCGNLFSAWSRRLEPAAPIVLIVALLLSGVACVHAGKHLRIDTDLDNLVSRDLPFRRSEIRVREQFPQLFDVLVMVLDADTPEAARTASLAYTRALATHTDVLQNVHAPRSDPFVEKNGLLYESVEELESITQRLADIQPVIGTLRRDRSLRGFFGALETAYEEKAQGEELDLGRMTADVDATIRAALTDERRDLSWRALLVDEPLGPDDRRQYVIATPVVDPDRLHPLGPSVDVVRSTWAGLPLEVRKDVRMRLTGGAALSHEELGAVMGSMLLIGLIVVVLVGIVLIRGLRSVRLVVASLVTVGVGLAWTAAIATLVVGRLNIVSVAFGILYVGLSVDYAIHICLRYREGILRHGLSHIDALCVALRYVGGSLVIATITTAIGFFSFVPTAYSGVSELGLIAGTGMFISLFANTTVLPAILVLLPMRHRPPDVEAAAAGGHPLREFPVRRPRPVLIASLMLGVAALVLVPLVRFDFNPLNLNNPKSEAVRTFRDLLATSKTPPWTLHVLAQDEAQAATYAASMRALPAVRLSLSMPDLIPEAQDEKLAILEDTALTLGVGAPVDPRAPPSLEEQVAAIEAAGAAMEAYLGAGAGRQDEATRRLRRSLDGLLAALATPAAPDVVRRLEHAALGTLEETLDLLDTALGTEGFTREDVPERLVGNWVNAQGIYRVEAFPEGDLNDMEALREYAEAVEEVIPGAAGTPIAMLSTSDVVVDAFTQAMTYALVMSIVVLLLLLQSVRDVALVLLPLVVAAILTAGLLVVLDMPFNFANVIALPMLFGIGIDNGVHMVHRARELPPGRSADINLLQTSTSRGIVFSTLTTTCAFGSLALSQHAGTASMGLLLTLGMCITLLCTVVTLPALLTWLGDRKAAAGEIGSAEGAA